MEAAQVTAWTDVALTALNVLQTVLLAWLAAGSHRRRQEFTSS